MNRHQSAEIFLGLGGNTGKPEVTITRAYEELSVSLVSPRLSSLFITEPMDVKDQPEFINAVCSGRFSGRPEDLLKLVNSIETKLGRNRSKEQRRGPRAIDIDILLFGDLVIYKGPELIIPHSRLKERRFALQPMLELEPDLIDPVTGKSFSQFLDKLSGQGIYYFRTNRYI